LNYENNKRQQAMKISRNININRTQQLKDSPFINQRSTKFVSLIDSKYYKTAVVLNKRFHQRYPKLQQLLS
jgi:hypothetical protein